MIKLTIDALKMKHATLKFFPGMTEEVWFAYFKALRVSGALLDRERVEDPK